MEQEKKSIDTRNSFKKGSLKSLIWKIPIFIVALFLSFFIFLYLILTFNFTKSFLLNVAINIANNSFNGRISFESVNFSPFKGIVLNNLLVSLNSDTIAYVDKVLLDWDLEPIFKRNIVVKKIVLFNPKINLVKEYGDSLWNFQKFLKPSKAEENQSKTNLRIFINLFELKNGTFKFTDKNHKSNENFFDPNNLWIDNANLELSGNVNLQTEKYSFVVKNVSFVEKNSNLSLKKLSAGLVIDSSRLAIDDFVVETLNSKISGNIAYLPSKAVLDIDLKNSLVNTSEIKKFSNLPIGGDISLRVKGNIEIGENLKFQNVAVNLNSRSYFTVDGFLKNVNEPNLELQISNLRVFEKDIRRALPDLFNNLNLNFGILASKKFNFHYQNHNVFIQGDFTSEPARFKTDLLIDSQNVLHYKIEFDGVDLGYLFPQLPKSNISGKSEGEITLSDIKNLNGNLSLDIYSGKLDLKGFENFKISASSLLKNGVIYIDTLSFLHFDKNSEHQMGSIVCKGKLDISRMNDINYSFDFLISELPLNSFFEEPNYLPERITARFQFDGKGFDLNSIYLDLKAQVDEFVFSDKSLLPFNIALNINHLDSANKHILVESDVLRGDIKGNYNLFSLIDNFSSQFLSIAKDFENKFENVFKNKDQVEGENLNSVSSNSKKSKMSAQSKPFETVKAHFQINDFSILGMFLKTNLAFTGNFSLKLTSTQSESKFELDTFHVGYFSFRDGDKRVDISNFAMKANYETAISNNEIALNNLLIYGATSNRVIFGDSYFDYFDINLNYNQDKLSGKINTTYSSTAGVNIDFGASFSDSLIVLNFNKLAVFYNNIFQWYLFEPVSFTINSQSLSFKDFLLIRENAEKINISGIYFFNDSTDLSLEVYDIPLYDMQKLLPKENNFSKVKNFQGKVDFIKLNVKNSLQNPNISLNLLVNDLSLDNFEVGAITAGLNYLDGNLSGKLRLTNKNFSPLDVDLIEVPVNIDLGKAKFSILEDKEFRAFLNCDRFSLSLLNPFLSDFVDGLQGSLSVSTLITGSLPEDIKLNGTAEIIESSFIPLANNLKYFLSGKIYMKGTEYFLDNLIIRNSKNDYPDGSAKVFGKILFSNNRLYGFEASLSTEGLKILSNASEKTLPQLYGDLVISTTPNNLRFVYDRNEMLLQGNVNFLRGKLYMPGTSGGSSVSESFVQYEISGSKKDDTLDSKPERTKEVKQPTNLKIDIFLRFLQPVELTLDLITIGQIYAIISLANNNSSLRFYYDPQNNVTLLTGNDLILREGSTLKFVKLFNTEGSLSFPTGAIDNPGLNLKAQYNGQSIYNDMVRNFTVTIYITGTREKPNLRFDYTIDGQPAVDDSSKVAQDAIFLLAFGKTKSEVEKSGVSGGFNLSEFSTSGSSVILSKIVTDALSGTGFISSADIVLPPSASLMDKATLKVGGRFLGMTWNFGGTMADLLNNNELSIEIPVGTVLPFNLPNIILQLSKSSNLTQSVQRNQKDWEIKLKYGSNW